MTETLHEAAQAYLEHLKGEGKKERTLYTYGKDFKQIEAFFGVDRKLTGILAPHVGKFFRSDALLKLPSGKERSRAHGREDQAGASHVPGLGLTRRAESTSSPCPRAPPWAGAPKRKEFVSHDKRRNQRASAAARA